MSDNIKVNITAQKVTPNTYQKSDDISVKITAQKLDGSVESSGDKDVNVDVTTKSLIDYNSLLKRPKINGVTLEGDLTLEQLGAATQEDVVSLEESLSQEIQDRISEGVELNDKISANTSRISELNNSIIIESELREDADDLLDGKINSIKDELQDSISSETQNRISSDNALQEQITNNYNKFNDYRTSANQDIIDDDIKQSINSLSESKQDKLTAGTGIEIKNNVISNTQKSAEWGNITGTLSEQTDLKNALDNKQDNLTAGTNIEIKNNTISVVGDVGTEVIFRKY